MSRRKDSISLKMAINFPLLSNSLNIPSQTNRNNPIFRAKSNMSRNFLKHMVPEMMKMSRENFWQN